MKEYSLVVLKPDATEAVEVSLLKHFGLQNLKVISHVTKKLSKDDVRNFFERFFNEKNNMYSDYMTEQPSKAYLIEGDASTRKCQHIKYDIRKKYGIAEKMHMRNLIHVAESDYECYNQMNCFFPNRPKHKYLNYVDGYAIIKKHTPNFTRKRLLFLDARSNLGHIILNGTVSEVIEIFQLLLDVNFDKLTYSFSITKRYCADIELLIFLPCTRDHTEMMSLVKKIDTLPCTKDNLRALKDNEGVLLFLKDFPFTPLPYFYHDSPNPFDALEMRIELGRRVLYPIIDNLFGVISGILTDSTDYEFSEIETRKDAKNHYGMLPIGGSGSGNKYGELTLSYDLFKDMGRILGI